MLSVHMTNNRAKSPIYAKDLSGGSSRARDNDEVIIASEIAAKADFSRLRYSQCWEDADVLVEAARIKSTDNVLSICSSGDNTLSLLACGPKSITAIDLSTAQLACLELRVAAFQELTYQGVLDLLGFSNHSERRLALYKRCRPKLSTTSRHYWDSHLSDIASGVTTSGKFERYLSVFRNVILPLAHGRKCVRALLTEKSASDRQHFFVERWNNRRWRLLFVLFFNRFVMGLIGRDKTFFEHVEHEISTSKTLAENTRRALTEQDPSNNPYLHWILYGHFGKTLPFYLRPENYEKIKNNLSRLSWEQCSVEQFLNRKGSCKDIDVFNLSDIFEYVSQEQYELILDGILERSQNGARLIYWNMLVSRSRPARLSRALQPNISLAESLFKRNQTFFYKKLIIEEVVC